MGPLGSSVNSVGLRDETSAGEVTAMALRGLAALLFLGGIVYALLSGNWGIGAIVFSLGAVLLGSGRLRVAQSRSDRAIGWVLILSGVFVIVDAIIWISVGEA